MADFCKECSEDLFGKDYGDLKEIADPGGLAWVICEGCKDHVRWPYILVGEDGRRRREIESAFEKQNPESLDD